MIHCILYSLRIVSFPDFTVDMSHFQKGFFFWTVHRNISVHLSQCTEVWLTMKWNNEVKIGKGSFFYVQYAVSLETKWSLLSFRVVEKGYYSERDAADAVKQVLEAVAVSLLQFLTEIVFFVWSFTAAVTSGINSPKNTYPVVMTHFLLWNTEGGVLRCCSGFVFVDWMSMRVYVSGLCSHNK